MKIWTLLEIAPNDKILIQTTGLEGKQKLIDLSKQLKRESQIITYIVSGINAISKPVKNKMFYIHNNIKNK